ncbi:MAG: serine hydrolase [Gammaproteobacteria bacterium]|nr:MAG: serine hydrolase [Gammaproteobacteria bacterium]
MKSIIIKIICIFFVAPLLVSSVVLAKAPTINQKDDMKHLGSVDKFLFWTPEQQVAGYRNINKIFPTRKILAGVKPLKLPEQLIDLANIKVTAEGRSITIDEYFVEQNIAGLLVLKDGKVAYERYGLGNDKDSLWISFSVSKSVTSMLIGAAIKDGYIKSVDEKVTDYLPRLKNSAYDQATIRNIMQMSSGVAWNEDYADPKSDINTAVWDTRGMYEFLRNKPRESEPGSNFNYNTAETNLVGTLLRSAIGNNLSTYLTDKIWQPFGMGSDANWMLVEDAGGEQGGCCINATLRDYARLGLFALSNGKLSDGTNVLPDNWMKDSTTPSKGYDGYGYLWWLSKGASYRAVGIFGQGIYINPEQNVVVAIQSARGVASNQSAWTLQNAFYAAITQAVK